MQSVLADRHGGRSRAAGRGTRVHRGQPIHPNRAATGGRPLIMCGAGVVAAIRGLTQRQGQPAVGHITETVRHLGELDGKTPLVLLSRRLNVCAAPSCHLTCNDKCADVAWRISPKRTCSTRFRIMRHQYAKGEFHGCCLLVLVKVRCSALRSEHDVQRINRVSWLRCHNHCCRSILPTCRTAAPCAIAMLARFAYGPKWFSSNSARQSLYRC